MKRSNIAQISIGFICVALIFCSIPFAMGSLYKTGVEKQFEVYNRYLVETKNKASEEVKARRTAMLETINLLTTGMLKWNGYDPVHLSYAAYTELLNSYALDNTISDIELVKHSAELNKAAIELRPIYPDIYAQQAYVFYELKKPIKEILQSVRLASRFGPYEGVTAKTGIDLYFNYWGQIGSSSKETVAGYLLMPKKYGLNSWRVSQLIRDAKYKNQACKLIKYSGGNSDVCT